VFATLGTILLSFGASDGAAPFASILLFILIFKVAHSTHTLVNMLKSDQRGGRSQIHIEFPRQFDTKATRPIIAGLLTMYMYCRVNTQWAFVTAFGAAVLEMTNEEWSWALGFVIVASMGIAAHVGDSRLWVSAAMVVASPAHVWCCIHGI
jgi:hypothetical protein